MNELEFSKLPIHYTTIFSNTNALTEILCSFPPLLSIAVVIVAVDTIIDFYTWPPSNICGLCQDCDLHYIQTEKLGSDNFSKVGPDMLFFIWYIDLTLTTSPCQKVINFVNWWWVISNLVRFLVTLNMTWLHPVWAIWNVPQYLWHTRIWEMV